MKTIIISTLLLSGITFGIEIPDDINAVSLDQLQGQSGANAAKPDGLATINRGVGFYSMTEKNKDMVTINKSAMKKSPLNQFESIEEEIPEVEMVKPIPKEFKLPKEETMPTMEKPKKVESEIQKQNKKMLESFIQDKMEEEKFEPQIKEEINNELKSEIKNRMESILDKFDHPKGMQSKDTKEIPFTGLQ